MPGLHRRRDLRRPRHFVPVRRSDVQARLVHGGRQTQVWDATVTDEAGGKTIALFRCTQMILRPKA